MNMVIFTIANLKTNSGNVTLMRRRATALFIEKGIFTTFLIMGRNNDSFIEKGDGYSYRIVQNKEELFEALKKVRPEYIVYYGGRSYFYRSKIKRYLEKEKCQCIHLLDVQGVVEETKEYGKGFLNRKIIYKIKKLLFIYMINYVDGVFVVSDELKEYCRESRLWRKERLEIFKIRCGVTETLNTETKQKYRNSIRNKLGIDDNTTVFVYSGYRMAWQKVDDIIEHFKEFDKILLNSYFAFFCDTDKNFEIELERNFPKNNFYAKLIPQSEYFEHLCACDVGYLLRDYNTTNKVAFPNKFSDYINAGLLIGINKALPEPCRLLESYSISYVDTDTKPDQSAKELILKRQSELNKYYIQCEKLSKNELEFSEQIRGIEI